MAAVPPPPAAGVGPPPKLPWLRPGVALAVGGLLAAATVALLVWVAGTDPGNGCDTGGLPALALAGTVDRAETILACPGLNDVEAAREAIYLDFLLIVAYVVTIAGWCAYGALRSRREPTRRALYGLVPVVVFAGLLDGAENVLLLMRVFDDDQVPTMPSSGTVDALFAVAVARWILVVVTGLTALCVFAGTVAKVARTVWGSSTRPGFLGRLPGLADPMPFSPDLVQDDGEDALAARKAAHARRFDAPGRVASSAEQVVGIGVSGGGIRAASVALGAVQSLIATGVYARARYLASVSGGGYLAGASQLLARFGADYHVPGPAPFTDEAPEVDFVRDRARFLWPPIDRTTADPLVRRRANLASTRGFFSSAMWGLLGILFNVGLILAVVYVIVIPIGWLARWLYTEPGGEYVQRVTYGGGWWAMVLVLVALGPHLGSFLYGFLGSFVVADPRSTRRGRGVVPRLALVVVIVGASAVGVGALLRWGLPASAWWPRWTWSLIGLLIAFAVVALVVAFTVERSPKGVPAFVLLTGLVLIAANWLDGAIEEGWDAATTWRAVVTIGAVLVGLATFVAVAAMLRLPPVPRSTGTFAVLLLLTLLSGFGAGIVFGVAVWAQVDDERIGQAWVVYVTVAATVLVGYAFLDQKRWSPHPIYKRRLAGTFSPVRYIGPDGSAKVDQLPYSTRTNLSRWLGKVDGHPELLLCAAAYDTRKATGSVRAWPFVFSADYIGGADVGWTRTVDFEAALGRANAGDGTVLAAMAVSGAAVSSGLGQISLGSLNIVLALLNARLGVWLPNPRYVNELRDNEKSELARWPSREASALRWLRTRRATYLVKEVLGIHDRDDRFLYVTDGGQLDNLGLLELLSRRCDLIVCIDASGDDAHTTNTFDGVRRLAADRMGIELRALPGTAVPAGDPEDYLVDPVKVHNGWLTPDLCSRASQDELLDPWPYALGPDRLSRRDVVRLNIVYPDRPEGPHGTLIYAKAVLTGDTPAATLKFADSSPKFPRDSTADQFLEPDQVKHYVALGRHLGQKAGDLAQTLPVAPPSAVCQ